MTFKQLLSASKFVSFDYDVPGSRVFLPAGWKFRNLLYDFVVTKIRAAGYEEIHLPNLISSNSLQNLVKIYRPPDYYYLQNETYLAATHEAAFFTFAKRHISRDIGVYRAFNLGSAYRCPKNAKSPFNFGERNSFLEMYYIDNNKDSCDNEISRLNKLNAQCIIETLGLPSVNVKRPLFGNYGFSNATVTVETHLPEGRTLTSGMIYDQGDMFTRKFGLFSSRQPKFSVHAAFTDNLLYSYLANCRDNLGFFLHSWLSPLQVLICCPSDSIINERFAQIISDAMNSHMIRNQIIYYTKKPSKSVRSRFLLQGIPVSITLDNESAGHGEVNYYLRATPNDPIRHKLDINIILESLEQHDASLKLLLQDRKNKCIVNTSNIEQARAVVRHGLIAACYLHPSEDLTRNAEGLIGVGEMLGIQLLPSENGKCVLTGATTGVMCYFSRRV